MENSFIFSAAFSNVRFVSLKKKMFLLAFTLDSFSDDDYSVFSHHLSPVFLFLSTAVGQRNTILCAISFRGLVDYSTSQD